MTAGEQIPVLCRQCGGRARVLENWQVDCSFCHTQDQLPHDQLQRALELKSRLATAARGALQLTGTERALAHIFEDRRAFWRASSTFIIVPLLLTPLTCGSAVTRAFDDQAHWFAYLVHSLVMLIIPGGFALAIVVPLWLGRRTYRRRVRPALLARAPLTLGAVPRCRACGADLQQGEGPLFDCSHCGTRSLATEELHRQRAALLEHEMQNYRLRATGIVASTARISTQMGRAFIVTAVFVVVAQFGFAALSQHFFVACMLDGATTP